MPSKCPSGSVRDVYAGECVKSSTGAVLAVALIAGLLTTFLLYYFAPTGTAALLPFTAEIMGGPLVWLLAAAFIAIGVVLMIAGFGLFRRIGNLIIAGVGGIAVAVGLLMCLIPLPFARIFGIAVAVLGGLVLLRSLARPISRVMGMFTMIAGVVMVGMGILAFLFL